MSTVAVVLDGVDITDLSIEGSVTTKLNRVGQAQVKCNMLPIVERFGTLPDCGSYLKVYFDGDLFHHGRVMTREVTADENTGYAVFNSSDPMELWQWRPVRGNLNGNFSNPNIFYDAEFAPSILAVALLNSEFGIVPTEAEGPTRLDLNSFAGGTKSLIGAPVDWPMTIMELFNLLASTGLCDAIITPIEFDGNNNYGRLDIYEGDYGDDKTGDVVFQYGMGVRNVRSLRWETDMTQLCNKLFYFLSPRCDQEHWRANVQGDDPAFNPDVNPTGGWSTFTAYSVLDTVTNGGFTWVCKTAHTDVGDLDSEPGVGANWPLYWAHYATPPGGKLSPPASSTNNPIGVRSADSRDTYDVRMDIKLFDAVGDSSECFEVETVVGHDLYRRLWQCEQFLRAIPRALVHITPTRDTAIGDFTIGDLITVEAVSDVLGGFSGAQRVYEFTISWDEDSVPALGEIQTSSDQEGLVS